MGAASKSQGRVGDSRQSLSKLRPLASAPPQAEKRKHAPRTLGPLSGELEGQSPEIFVWAKQPGASISAFCSETVYCKHQPCPSMSQLAERAWVYTGQGRNRWS